MLLSDEQLITDYLKGDEKALEVLIERYLKLIYSFVYRHVYNASEAEDITQETFVRAWRNLKKFDRRRIFKTWIFSIAKNACIDFLRKKKTIPFVEFENEEGENMLTQTLVDTNPLPDEILERADEAKRLSATIGKLPVKYRMVLFLRYNDHFSFREIGEILEEPLNTVKSRHRRGLVLLKNLLG